MVLLYGARTFILHELVKQIVYDKNIEYGNTSEVKLKIEGDIKTLWVNTIPYQVKIHISNLVNNAIESMSSSYKIVWLELNNNDNFIILKIKDTGCGMPNEKIEAVLSGKSYKHSGKGLGLSGAKRYFEDLGGGITIKSTENRGTTVEVFIPISKIPKWFNSVIPYTKDTAFIKEAYCICKSGFLKGL